MRPFDVLACGAAGQTAQPVVTRAGAGGGLGRGSQGSIDGIADLLKPDVSRQLGASRRHEGERVFFTAQVAHHHHPENPGGLARWPQGGCGLVNDARLVTPLGWQGRQGRVLQHHQVAGQIQRLPGHVIVQNIAVQVGAGQHDHQRLVGPCLGPGGNGRRRAAGVQRDHRIGWRVFCHWRLRRPLRQQRNVTMIRQKLRPSVCGVPVAVVGFGHGRRHQHHFFQDSSFGPCSQTVWQPCVAGECQRVFICHHPHHRY